MLEKKLYVHVTDDCVRLNDTWPYLSYLSFFCLKTWAPATWPRVQLPDLSSSSPTSWHELQLPDLLPDLTSAVWPELQLPDYNFSFPTFCLTWAPAAWPELGPPDLRSFLLKAWAAAARPGLNFSCLILVQGAWRMLQLLPWPELQLS